jgi:hypothetical protein
MKNLWIDQTACTPDTFDLFFSRKSKEQDKAIAICNSCPVKLQCLRTAVANNEEFGIFGGKTPDERKNIQIVH